MKTVAISSNGHLTKPASAPSKRFMNLEDLFGSNVFNEALMRQRLETLARRYMRDLRRTAFVDVRV